MIDDGDIVGEVILHDIRSPHNRMEIWKIAVAAPGKGVGRKALELAVDRCFDVHGAHRVWLDLKLYNDRARRVYKALGFVSEGIARDSYLYEGEYESLEIMSVLRPSGGAGSVERLPDVGFAQHQPPRSGIRACRPEVAKVERQDRQTVAFRVGHHGSIDEAKLEVGVVRVQLCGAAQQAGGEKGGRVGAGGNRLEQAACAGAPDPGAEHVVGLREHNVQQQEIAPERLHQVRSEWMSRSAPVGRRDERAGVGYDPHPFVSVARESSARTSSTRKASSGSPLSPEPIQLGR